MTPYHVQNADLMPNAKFVIKVPPLAVNACQDTWVILKQVVVHNVFSIQNVNRMKLVLTKDAKIPAQILVVSMPNAPLSTILQSVHVKILIAGIRSRFARKSILVRSNR